MRIALFTLLMISAFFAPECFASKAKHKRKPASEGAIRVFQTDVVDNSIVPLAEKTSLNFSAVNPKSGTPTFVIRPEKTYQKMEGFGANFTESCAMNIWRLPREMRRDVMQKMFSKANGAGFDYLRLPLGATDFADGGKGSYTYDDTKDAQPDPEFKHLDLSRDEKTFALIREAVRINPHVHVMISPWTAPAWMKPNKELHDGWLDPERYADYANYFVRITRELQKRGVPVDSLTIQNEPFYSTKGYPSMYMSGKDQQRFIGDFLGPKLESEKMPVRIYSHDHNWGQSAESNEMLQYPAARKYTFGVAYHCYWGTKFSMYDTYNAYPEKALIQTECTGTSSYLDGTKSDPINDFSWWLDNQSIGAARMGPTGTGGALGWNLCLDEKNGPQNGIKDDPNIPNGGCKDCRGMVQMDFSGKIPKVNYNGEFFGLAQVSRFISPQSYRIGMDGDVESLPSVTFRNADGTIVLAVHNNWNDQQTFSVLIGNKTFSYDLAGRSAVTFLWK